MTLKLLCRLLRNVAVSHLDLFSDVSCALPQANWKNASVSKRWNIGWKMKLHQLYQSISRQMKRIKLLQFLLHCKFNFLVPLPLLTSASSPTALPSSSPLESELHLFCPSSGTSKLHWYTVHCTILTLCLLISLYYFWPYLIPSLFFSFSFSLPPSLIHLQLDARAD